MRVRALVVLGYVAMSAMATYACSGELFGGGDDDSPPPSNGADGGDLDGGADGPPITPPPPGCDPAVDPKDSAPCVSNEFGLFVSPTGDDANAGTKEAPFATLHTALAVLAQGGKRRIYVCSGSGQKFVDSLTIDDRAGGLGLYGGFSCGDWSYAGGRAMLAPSTPGAIPITIGGVTTAVTIEDFDVRAPAGAPPGGSSIAMLVHDTIGVKLARVALTAGAGAHGADGTTLTVDVGTPAAHGNDATGPLGSSSQFHGAYAGGLATGCTCPNGEQTIGGGGGNSYASLAARYVATSGGDGVPAQSTPGGDGGAAGGQDLGGFFAPCGVGGTGANGAQGLDGQGGAGGAGAIAASGWSGALATAGSVGHVGQGGGGGGGYDDSTNEGAGGAGGCGGCGGGGGSAGGAGGASIALVAIASPVTLDGCDVTSGAGGPGGVGGPGQSGGQPGGPGGNPRGALVGQPTMGTDRACPGGTGGVGGPGGGGGGGSGGASFAIAIKGTGAPRVTASRTVAGAGGPGGAAGGGASSGGAAGAAEAIHVF